MPILTDEIFWVVVFWPCYFTRRSLTVAANFSRLVPPWWDCGWKLAVGCDPGLVKNFITVMQAQDNHSSRGGSTLLLISNIILIKMNGRMVFSMPEDEDTPAPSSPHKGVGSVTHI